jgi:hypothetical protein
MKADKESQPQAFKLKRCISVLENMSIRTIQNYYLKDLRLPSRRKAKKPLLTERMKDRGYSLPGPMTGRM